MATSSQRQETPECCSFRKHYDGLYHVIQDPLSLATRLYSQGIVAPAVKEQMSVVGLSRLEKNNVLLSAVEMQIQLDASVLYVFLATLNEDPSMQSLAESMQRGLLRTTSGPHGEDWSVESRDGGEELSTPAVKRKCMCDENSVSVLSGLGASIYGEPVTLPRQVTHQHYQNQQPPHHRPPHHCHRQHFIEHQSRHSNFQTPSHSLYQPPINAPPQVWQPPIQSPIYLSSHSPSFRPSQEQPSYQYTEPTHPSHYQPSHCIPNSLHFQNAHILPRLTPHQQLHYQPHYQMPLHSAHRYQPPYQHPSPDNSPSSRHTYHQTSTFQHPGYKQTSTFHSPQLPSFQHNKTPFRLFCQAHLLAPVQPIYSYKPLHQPASPYPSQPALPPPPDSPLEKYAQFVRYYYMHHSPCTKWPQLDTRKYINLAVINNDYANREDLVQFRKQTICGCIDDILGWKTPIEMKDILQPNCSYGTPCPVTQLLIEGAPGIGKSTFAWEVCQNWGQHQLFNEYSLVVLLKFRDKRVQEAKSVSDLFYYPQPKLHSDIVHDIVLSGGHGLLLILEGFDEAPASKRTMDSIFVRLFTGQELPKATVILTTRPSASAELRQLCKGQNSRRIGIVGFGKKEIEEYIHCAFSDEQSRSDFKEYLSLYPHIHSMMYVPLNSAIVTHVYESCKSSGAVIPKTMTQLYSSLIRTLLLRYLKDKEKYKDTCTNINSFKDLPQPVYDQFCEICKIAYTGMMCAETELIFQDLPNDFDPLGLMQTCPELYVDRGASVSYNFLHLTVQEYLAAYHISQQSRDEQVAFMREHIESKKLEAVVRFLAGLSELGRNLWNIVRGFASDGKSSCLWIEEETNFIKLNILHCLFESQDPSAITSVLGSECVCFCHFDILPFDWYVLGYCITHSSCDWKLEFDHGRQCCERESIELFLRALSLQQDQCQLLTGKIKEVWLSRSDPAAVHLLVENMSRMLVFSNLTHLGLVESDLTSATCNLLSKHTDMLQHLECLDLRYNTIGRGGAVNLITSLTKFSTIRELNLNFTDIGFEDCKALSESLATSKYVKVLVILDCKCGFDNAYKLSSDSVQLIVDGLSLNTSLEKLDISGSNFSSENVLHLASVLRVNTCLKELNIIYCNIQSSDFVHLAKALEKNTTTQLQTLWLMGNPIGSEGAVDFADMLATNKSLDILDMSECSIQGEGAVCLAKGMEKNSTVREFDISDNPIGSEGAVAFADMLATNKSLTQLNMCKCSIQGEGVICLAKALKKNSTLKEFVISYNTIGSEGAVAFASMLKKNQCLKTLDLGDDSVGVEGALELIESLKHNTTLERLRLSEKCKPPSFSTLLQDRIKFC